MAKSLSITLYMSELIYDFQNKAYLTGRARRPGTDSETASNIQASDDDEDLNQALRSIQSAYGSLLTELAEALHGDKTTTSTNQLTTTSANISISLKMPGNYVLGIREALTAGMHSYIVNMALGEWFLITSKEDAKAYFDLAAAAAKSIHEAINRRERPTRKSVTP